MTRQMPGSDSATSRPRSSERSIGVVGPQCGEIVLEDEGRGVVGIPHPAGSRVARAKITLRVVDRLAMGGGLLDLPLPGALGAVRRHQHPFAGERVKAPLGGAAPIEHPPLWPEPGGGYNSSFPW